MCIYVICFVIVFMFFVVVGNVVVIIICCYCVDDGYWFMYMLEVLVNIIYC